MANIDFPANPIIGQIYIFNNITWVFNGAGWVPQSVNSPAGPIGGIQLSYSTDSPPVSLTNGYFYVYAPAIGSGTWIDLSTGDSCTIYISQVDLYGTDISTYLANLTVDCFITLVSSDGYSLTGKLNTDVTSILSGCYFDIEITSLSNVPPNNERFALNIGWIGNESSIINAIVFG